MAKSERKLLETAADETTSGDEFDQEALLNEDLSSLPEEQQLTGPWVLQWVSSFINHGVSDEKGPWVMLTINFDPYRPFGDDAEEIMSEIDMKDLPRIRHRAFYTTNKDKREFRQLLAKFGVEAAPLGEMLKAARGQLGVATLKPSKDRRTGAPETRLSNFRAVPIREVFTAADLEAAE